MTTLVTEKAPTLDVTKTALAKVLASEAIRVQHRPVPTASFDCKRRVLTLPVFDAARMTADLYDLFVGHEVGHALFTPSDFIERCPQLKRDRRLFSLFNIIEDVRIEKMIRRRYAGLTAPFFRAYESLFADNFFTRNTPAQIRAASFPDRLNIHFKVGQTAAVPFKAAERDLVTRIGAVETFDEVIALVMELAKFLEARKEEVKPATPAEPEEEKSEEEKPSSRRDKSEDEDEDASDDADEDGEEEDADEDDEEEDADDADEDGEESDDADEEEDADEEADTDASDDADEDGEESDEEQDDRDDSEGDFEDDTDGEESDEDTSEDEDADSAEPMDEDESEDADEATAADESDAPDGGPGAAKHGLDRAEEEDDSDEEEDDEEEDEDSIGTEDFGAENFQKAQGNFDAFVDANATESTYLTLDVASRVGKDIILTYGCDMRTGTLLPDGFAATFAPSGEGAKVFAKFSREVASTVNHLVLEFDRKKKANMSAKVRTTTLGTLDTNLLHKAMFAEDIFKRDAEVPEGKNHGLVLVIDWSSSMDKFIKQNVRQVMILTMFAKRAGIPFEVWLFRDPNHSVKTDCTDVADEVGDNVARFDDVELVQLVSSRMNTMAYNRAMAALALVNKASVQRMSRWSFTGTPLNGAIYGMMAVIEKFQAANRVDHLSFIVVSDGDGCGTINSETVEYETVGYSGYGTRRATKRLDAVLQDPRTRKSYGIAVETGASAYEISRLIADGKPAPMSVNVAIESSLLDAIRLRYKARTIGFYLGTTSYSVQAGERLNSSTTLGYKPGYDEYYLISPTVDISTDDFGDTLAGRGAVTPEEITRSLASFGKSRQDSKTILSRFIDRITEDELGVHNRRKATTIKYGV